jgi:hypothetical protein
LESAHFYARLLTLKPASIHPGSRDGGGVSPRSTAIASGGMGFRMTARRFQVFSRTRWSDLSLFASATFVAMAIVTMYAALASGAAPGDVSHAAASVASGANSWAAVVEALAIAVAGWCAINGRVSFSVRRRDDSIRIGARAW